MARELEARKAVVVALKAAAGLTALVPAARIFGERVPGAPPARPWIKTTPPDAVPFQVSCHDSDQVTLNVSAFAEGPDMATASSVGKQIKDALHGAVLTADGEEFVVEWTGGAIIPDGAEPDHWHSFNTFTLI